jgi:hypothetical protein
MNNLHLQTTAIWFSSPTVCPEQNIGTESYNFEFDNPSFIHTINDDFQIKYIKCLKTQSYNSCKNILDDYTKIMNQCNNNRSLK